MTQSHNFEPARSEQVNPNANKLMEVVMASKVPRTEISVWESTVIDVVDDKSAALLTSGLNGCHVTLVVGREESGFQMGITHFPPEVGKNRYLSSLTEINKQIQHPTLIVTLVDQDRSAPEVHAAKELFPSTPRLELEYSSKSLVGDGGANPEKFVAVLDTTEAQGPGITIATGNSGHHLML